MNRTLSFWILLSTFCRWIFRRNDYYWSGRCSPRRAAYVAKVVAEHCCNLQAERPVERKALDRIEEI
jgi:hypothetical protein